MHLRLAIAAWITIHLAVAAVAAEPTDRLVAQLNETIASGTKYLLQKQSTDGAWRSEVYGPFKEGDALTPVIASVLLRLPSDKKAAAAIDRAADYLAAMAIPDGTIAPGPNGLSYPVYVSAGAVIVLSDARQLARHPSARDIWLKFLRQQQLADRFGWRPANRQYGGWGYASGDLNRPAMGLPVPPLVEPNISATVFALEALRAAGAVSHDPALKAARRFVEHCQNWNSEEARRDAEFDDGGFFFISDDPIRNKAGERGKDRFEQIRYASYGSTTADGLRALLLTAAKPDEERVTAAAKWLTEHFAADAVPGNFPADREPFRQATVYYYMNSAIKLQRAMQPGAKMNDDKAKSWAELFARQLIQRQQPDGSWKNTAVNVREDDPLVATPLALETSILCRSTLTDRAPN